MPRTQVNSHITVRELAQKMNLIFMYYCPNERHLAGKAEKLAHTLLERASVMMPSALKCKNEKHNKHIITPRTLISWASTDEKQCEKNKILMFTSLLKLNMTTFIDQSVEPFIRDLARSTSTITSLFEKFNVYKSKIEDLSWIRGLYAVYYETPHQTISVSLMYLSRPIKYHTPVKFCCLFHGEPQEYVGRWAYENNCLYVFFEGPRQDGVSMIIASLPAPNQGIVSFDGILLSRDMMNHSASPFSTKILIQPYLVGKKLDTHLKGASIEDIWHKLCGSIPDVIEKASIKELEITNDPVYTIMSQAFFKTLSSTSATADIIMELNKTSPRIRKKRRFCIK